MPEAVHGDMRQAVFFDELMDVLVAPERGGRLAPLITDKVLAFIRARLLILLHNGDVIQDKCGHGDGSRGCLRFRGLDDVFSLDMMAHSFYCHRVGHFIGVEAVDLALPETAEKRQFAHDFEVDDSVIQGGHEPAHAVMVEDVYLWLYLTGCFGVLAGVMVEDAPAYGLFV